MRGAVSVLVFPPSFVACGFEYPFLTHLFQLPQEGWSKCLLPAPPKQCLHFFLQVKGAGGGGGVAASFSKAAAVDDITLCAAIFVGDCFDAFFAGG